MKLWFAPNSEVPVYRQLVTQVSLAILAGDLQPGDRLPSVRDLARRYSLHPNTISTGYRQLEKEGWTEHKHGSGVFVCTKKFGTTTEQMIDFHISGFFRTARDLDMPGEIVRSRVAEWLTFPPPDHFLLVDPDPGIRAILLKELATFTKFPIVAVDLACCTKPEYLTAAIPLCRPSKTILVRDAIPFGYEIVTLPIRSAVDWLNTWLPVPAHPPHRHRLPLAGVPLDRAHHARCRRPRARSARPPRRQQARLAPRTRQDVHDRLRLPHSVPPIDAPPQGHPHLLHPRGRDRP